MNEWIFIGIFLIVATAIPAAPIILARFLGPRKPNLQKNSTYECGIETIGETWVQFRAQYYIFALVFVVFDIEAVYLFPWAVAYDKVGLWALVEAVLFLGILTVGLVYAWRKDALRWQ